MGSIGYEPLPGFSLVKATRAELAERATTHDGPAPHRIQHDPCGERMWAVGRYTAHITACPVIAAVNAQAAAKEAEASATYGQPPHRAQHDQVFADATPVSRIIIEATAVKALKRCYLATRRHDSDVFRLDLTPYTQAAAESFAEMLRGPWVGYAEVRVLMADRVDAFIVAGLIVPVKYA